nr:MAG TPA: hypothetical protein [Microviridae sp.]
MRINISVRISDLKILKIMYTLIYYVRKTKSEKVYENKYLGEDFRLKKDALRFLREISKECYIENGYTIEEVKNGMNCYRNRKDARGKSETIETRVRIERM